METENKLIGLYTVWGWTSYHRECYRLGSHEVMWDRWPSWNPKLIHHLGICTRHVEIPGADVLGLWQEPDGTLIAMWDNVRWAYLGPHVVPDTHNKSGQGGMYLAALEPIDDVIQEWHGRPDGEHPYGRRVVNFASIARLYKMAADYESGQGALQQFSTYVERTT
jgi:hypothetical protein